MIKGYDHWRKQILGSLPTDYQYLQYFPFNFFGMDRVKVMKRVVRYKLQMHFSYNLTTKI